MWCQTTVTSGDWSDPAVWSGGAVPAPGGTVNVEHPLTIDTDLSPTGTWTFDSPTTDPLDGTGYKFNPDAGTNLITVSAGVILSFEGGILGAPNNFNSGTIEIFGTLILGHTDLNNDADLNITVHPGGVLIINGNLVNKNNSGTFLVGGALLINGNYDGQTGSTELIGDGTIDTSGSITTNGGSLVFGSDNDCAAGPCSGSNLSCTFSNHITPGSTAICTGSSRILTASTNGSSPAYQWQSSTDNVTFSNAPGISTNPTYTTPSLTVTTYYKVQITSAGCTNTSGFVALRVLTGGGWVGTTNDWGTAGNWCSNSVPTSSTDVMISNGAGIANMPTIAAGTAAVCRDLTIFPTFIPGSSVTIAASATASLTIFGNVENNGLVSDNSTAATAGVILGGTTVQTVSGFTSNTFNNLTIANTSGASPSVILGTNNVAVNSNLTIASGVVDLNGFMLKLGTAPGNTGTLTYTAGRLCRGNLLRWYPASAVSIGNASLFPMGSVSNDRPLYVTSTGLTSGGTIKVNHTPINGTTPTLFSDAGIPVEVRSNSFWTIATGNGMAGAGTPLSIRTDGTGMGTVGALTDLRLTLQSAAAPGTDGAHAGTLTNPQVNRTGISVAGLANNYYWGSIDQDQTPLPVTLLYFKGKFVDDHVELSWKTGTETNSDRFSIYHFQGGESFDMIGEVRAQGTTTRETDYLLNDWHPLPGINYYQLRQIDRDGKTTSYPLLKVVTSPAVRGLIIYPNPASGSGHITIELNAVDPLTPTDIQIISPQGAPLFNTTAVANETGRIICEAPVSSLGPGVYIIRAGSRYQILVVNSIQ